MVLLFELPLCREALGKILGFAMWSLGAVAGAVGANSSEAHRSLAGEGWGGVYGPLGSYLGTRSVGRGGRWAAHRRPAVAAVVASAPARRGCGRG
jgi:hypothetical protein